jgi:signal transduction histidine kinase
VRKDGTFCLISWSNTATLSEQGDVELIIGTGTDVTEQRALQQQLLQAQKMEAIGQLTGGVAHDFNNLLTAILGNLEMLEMWHGDDERSGKAISQAQEAADLGAELTGRLLAFARRQPLDPKATSFSDIVFEMSDLLARTLGETIKINTVLANPLDTALVDPAQLQNALLNLCLNARDAMPDGGRLTIETANVELDEDYARDYAEVNAGDYVLLSVTDTGIGMAPEIRDRVFEPFFTTKEVGKGSGLGLSMIYGFVKQSGGHIRLYSEVGHGTAVSLYFPKAMGTTDLAEAARSEEAMPQGCGEVVLVAEDEPWVRQVTVQRLETLGYTVLEAENGRAALDLLAKSPTVDLVFTDIAMLDAFHVKSLALEIARQEIPHPRVIIDDKNARGCPLPALDRHYFPLNIMTL